ncbi:MAG TPA: hypothetical protein VNT02_08970, partial [Burkholderiales bacterium]|nr:hypothetical protein [Burkholderiales bacterium]
MASVRILLAAAALMLAACGTMEGAAQTAQRAREHVVIQVSDDSVKTWNQALNVASNLQKAYDGNVDVELVAFGNGIGMLQMDSEVGNRISEARRTGVKVIACENTMRGHHLTKADMLADIA